MNPPKTRVAPSAAQLLTWLLIGMLGIFVLWPTLSVFSAALVVDGHLTWRPFLTVLETPFLLRSLWHSLVVGVLGTILAVGLAFVFAFTTTRTTLPLRRLFGAVALLPLVSPPVVLSMALLLLFGKQGLFTPLLTRLTGLTDIYGPVGIVLALGLTYLPHAYLILVTALSRLDTPVEEAATSLGARFWTLLRRITLPMAGPALVRACLTVFVLCLTDFGNPMMIGGDFKVAAVYLFDLIYRSVDDTPVSAALGAIIVVPCLVAYVTAQRLASRTRLTGSSKGGRADSPPTPLPMGARVLFGGICLCVSLGVLALYTIIGVGAFVDAVGADWTPTLKWFDPSTPGNGWELLSTTVHLALIAAALGAPVSILIAWLTHRARPRGSSVLIALAMGPAALPGVIFGLGWLMCFHAPPLALTHTPWILILCLCSANLYVGVLSGTTALEKVDPAEEEAAVALGARGLTPFFRVVLPQLATAYISAFFFIFVRACISLSAIVFLVSANWNVISVAILNRGEAGDYGLACAMAVQILGVVLVAQGGLAVLEGALRPFQTPSGWLAPIARITHLLSPLGGEAGSRGRRLRLAGWTAAGFLMVFPLVQPEKEVLNVIGAFDEDEFYEYLEGFRHDHPEIEVHGQRLSSGQLVTRLIFEKDNPGFDVVFGLIDIYLAQLKEHGTLESYRPVGVERIPERYRDPDGYFFQLDLLLIAFGVNTEVLADKGIPIPSRWEDLTDPRLKGLVGVASPAASGTALTIFSRLVDMFQPDPWQYLDRLDQNVFQYTSSGAAPGKQAAQGEVGVGITFDFPLHKRRASGFPLEVVYPEKIPYTVEGAALIKGAHHPDVARVFLDWAASPRGMALWERRKAAITHPDVATSEVWKAQIPMDRLYEMRAPFDPDHLVKEWSRRYAR